MPSRVIRSNARSRALNVDARLRQEISQVCQDIGGEMLEKHKKVVRTWRHRPNFIAQPIVTPDFIGVQIIPRGKHFRIWQYVDKGTKGPYIIRPKRRGGVLRFQTGYIPKTVPVARVQAGGGVYTGGWRAAKQVIHPGIKARKFTEKFDRDVRPEFRRQINNAIRRALRR